MNFKIMRTKYQSPSKFSNVTRIAFFCFQWRKIRCSLCFCSRINDVNGKWTVDISAQRRFVCAHTKHRSFYSQLTIDLFSSMFSRAHSIARPLARSLTHSLTHSHSLRPLFLLIKPHHLSVVLNGIENAMKVVRECTQMSTHVTRMKFPITLAAAGFDENEKTKLHTFDAALLCFAFSVLSCIIFYSYFIANLYNFSPRFSISNFFVFNSIRKWNFVPEQQTEQTIHF